MLPWNLYLEFIQAIFTLLSCSPFPDFQAQPQLCSRPSICRSKSPPHDSLSFSPSSRPSQPSKTLQPLLIHLFPILIHKKAFYLAQVEKLSLPGSPQPSHSPERKQEKSKNGTLTKQRQDQMSTPRITIIHNLNSQPPAQKYNQKHPNSMSPQDPTNPAIVGLKKIYFVLGRL